MRKGQNKWGSRLSPIPLPLSCQKSPRDHFSPQLFPPAPLPVHSLFVLRDLAIDCLELLYNRSL